VHIDAGRDTVQRAPAPQAPRRRAPRVVSLRVVTALLIATGVLTVSYAGLSIYVATRLVYAPQEPIAATPAALGLAFHEVRVPSCPPLYGLLRATRRAGRGGLPARRPAALSPVGPPAGHRGLGRLHGRRHAAAGRGARARHPGHRRR